MSLLACLCCCHVSSKPLVFSCVCAAVCVLRGVGFVLVVSLKSVGASQAATHTCVADYSPSFDRCLSAQKGEKLIALPHTPDGSGEWIKLQRVSDGASGWIPAAFVAGVKPGDREAGGGLGEGLVLAGAG